MSGIARRQPALQRWQLPRGMIAARFLRDPAGTVWERRSGKGTDRQWKEVLMRDRTERQSLGEPLRRAYSRTGVLSEEVELATQR